MVEAVLRTLSSHTPVADAALAEEAPPLVPASTDVPSPFDREAFDNLFAEIDEDTAFGMLALFV